MNEFGKAVARTRGVQPWRRVFHMLGGVGTAAFVHYLGPESAIPLAVLATALAAGVALDWMRLRSRAANTLFFRTFAWLASPREAGRVASSTWFVLGALIVLLATPHRVFAPAMLVLACADPAASVIGRMWGRHKVGKGSWEGTAAFFVVAMGVLTPFVGIQTALIAATAVAIMEVLPLGIDDNLTVPISTALVLWAVGAAG
ncbi:MAG: hypothetical protein OXU69_10750 [Gemmatimonadota bacterium]|nr:hypothetical protein [Gemmatimonadota bacterium]MDE2985174.1 hypothetical protein [Gemmatimonadota bacterium]